MATSKRRSAVVTGAAFTVATLALGAAAFASSRAERGTLSSRSIAPRSLAVTKVGTSTATVAPNSTRDVQVLDAGVVTLVLDDTAGTFKVTKVVVEPGWEAATTVPDGTHASVSFTSPTRRVDVEMVLDAGVLTVTITEVPQGSTSSTSSSTTAPSSSSSSAATTTATTTPSTWDATTTPSVDPTVATTVADATCVQHEDDDDDEGDHQECDDQDDDEHATSQTSSGRAHDEDDDEDHGDDHGRGRGGDHDDD